MKVHDVITAWIFISNKIVSTKIRWIWNKCDASLENNTCVKYTLITTNAYFYLNHLLLQMLINQLWNAFNIKWIRNEKSGY